MVFKLQHFASNWNFGSADIIKVAVTTASYNFQYVHLQISNTPLFRAHYSKLTGLLKGENSQII